MKQRTVPHYAGLKVGRISSAAVQLLLVNPIAPDLVQLFQLDLQILPGEADMSIANSRHKLSNLLEVLIAYAYHIVYFMIDNVLAIIIRFIYNKRIE
jgi:hypothetical protein